MIVASLKAAAAEVGTAEHDASANPDDLHRAAAAAFGDGEAIPPM
jgi:hypothetical protein